MQAGAAQFNLGALRGRGMKEARKPRQRNPERTAVADRDPHGVLVEGDASRRNGHPNRRQALHRNCRNAAQCRYARV